MLCIKDALATVSVVLGTPGRDRGCTTAARGCGAVWAIEQLRRKKMAF